LGRQEETYRKCKAKNAGHEFFGRSTDRHSLGVSVGGYSNTTKKKPKRKGLSLKILRRLKKHISPPPKPSPIFNRNKQRPIIIIPQNERNSKWWIFGTFASPSIAK
jgi:hypothetical protein